MPGVRIDAAGGYGLASEQLNFRGVARLDAGMSRTLTGARRVLLWPFDPLLRKDGAGTRLVVDIGGTQNGADHRPGRRRVAARQALGGEAVEREWKEGNGVDDGIRTRDSRSHSPELYH